MEEADVRRVHPREFEEFIQEKQYLSNVSPATIYWYRQAFKRLQNPDPSAADLKQFVIRLRSDGINAESVNSWSRVINCYLKWRGPWQ
jgi:integrase/recombinase XerD